MLTEIQNILFTNPLMRVATISLTAIIASAAIRMVFQTVLQKALQRTKTNIDDQIVAVLGTPVFWSVFLVGTHYLISTSGLDVSTMKILINLVVSAGIILWGLAIDKIVIIFLALYAQKSERGGKTNDAIPFLKNISRILLLTSGIIATLSLWGIDITPLLASAGVAGIAIAFAAKDTISNLFGGVSVFFDKPYKVGDYVIIEQNYRGEVIQIGMRSTKIRTRDAVLITVPNSVMVTNAVINETGLDARLRIRIPISVSYDTDLEKAEYTLINILKKHKTVLEDPEPKVRYRKFAESSIDLEVLAVIESPEYKGRVTHELIKEVSKIFDEEKIKMPFPQTEIHIKKQN